MSGILRALARLFPRSLRNWIRSPGTTLRWIADEVRFRSGPSEVEVRPGWRLRCHPGAYRTAYHAHLADPEQRRELDAFVRACRPGMVLYDLGAHFGLFSLAALHYGGPDARAVAVEPSRSACRMLRLEADANAVSKRLTVIRAAAGEKPGRTQMIPVGVIAAGYYSAATADHGRRELEEVRVVTVDELARETGVWPTHLKIDVEGAEAAVLVGARSTLSRRPGPWISLELHNDMSRARGDDPAEPLRSLRQLGYEVRDLEGSLADAAKILSASLIRVTAQPA